MHSILLAIAGLALAALGCRDAAGPSPDAEQAPSAKDTNPKTQSDSRPARERVQSRSPSLTFQQLQALGYVDGTYDPNSHLSGVVVNDSERTNSGLNFYSSRHQQGAQLIDMKGRTIYTWESVEPGDWQHATLLPNGDVIVIVKDERLSRYDKLSNLLWSIESRFHHDLWIHGDEIYVLARRPRITPYIHSQTPTLVDVIQVRSMNGKLKREISLLDAIHRSPYKFLLPSVAHEPPAPQGTHLDVTHANHVEVFDGRLAGLAPIYKAGNVLTSMKNINAIAILDGSSGKVLWIWGPTNLTLQHHPTLLDNGHILLFDNGSEQSRVLEIDPLSSHVVWSYGPKPGFFSAARGSNQRLPNGNTLITESDRGYVHEVTPEGETVWKFANPAFTARNQREAIWRMLRVDPEELLFLD